MHHRTFSQLLAQHDRWMNLYFVEETKRLEAMLGLLQRMEGRLA